MRSVTGAIAVALGVASAAWGQTTISGSQQLQFNRPEAWALKYFASETLLTGLGSPERTGPWDFGLGLELGTVPALSTEQRTVGFDGTKEEDLNKIPFFVRPRASVGLPGDFTVMVAWVPPIRINGAKPNLFSASVGRPLWTPGDFRLGLKAYGQVGEIDGDFTCSATNAAAGSDSTLNPIGCTAPSDDHAWLRYAGLELSAAYRIQALGGLSPHLAVAGNYMNLDFDVNAQYQGVVDTTHLTTWGFTFSSAGGFEMPIGPVRLAVDAFYSPLTIQRPGAATQVDGLLNLRALAAIHF